MSDTFERYQRPSYDQLLWDEGPQVDQAYRDFQGPDRPSPADIRHVAWRRLVEGWTQAGILADIREPGTGHPGDWGTPPDGPRPAGLVGPVRLHGDRAAKTDAGPTPLVGLSRFYWTWAWRHDRDRVLRELDDDQKRGYHFARVLGQVGNLDGDDYWAGLVVSGDEPDHQDTLVGLTAAAAERGILIEWTLIGKGGRSDRQSWRRDYIRRSVQALATIPAGVFLVEIMNEPGVQGRITPDELVELHRIAKDSGPFLVGTGAAWDQSGTDWTPDAWARTQRGVGIVHLDRDQTKSERQDRAWRQGWDIGLEGTPWVDNEPIGPGASVATEDRPRVLRSHRLIAFICRAMATVYHADAGIRGRHPMTESPGYDDCPKAIRFLPGDLANGRQINANDHFPDRPFDVDQVRSESGRGVVRVYTCQAPDGRFYTVPFGPVSPFTLTARRGLTIDAFDQDLGDRLWTRQVSDGERLPLDLGDRPDILLVSQG